MGDKFERIVTVRPAYDCLVVQPCVHGSAECGTRTGASHGRHNAELHMIVRGSLGEVVLVVSTGWDLPETPQHVRSSRHDDYYPRGAYVDFHSPAPQYEGHEPQSTRCELWPDGCYGDAGYLMADEPTALLVRSGSDAVWEWLENTYREKFAPAADVEAGA